jgi:hypothetical protein
LISSSVVTTLLIPPAEFQPGGSANGRALAYLAHEYLGNTFGSAYDASTATILWFAGASAMADLLNLMPHCLPRYGMARYWARAAHPLVLILTLGAFIITIIFRADVDAQGGAYATGVLVVITSAAVAVTLAARQAGQRKLAIAFGLVTLTSSPCPWRPGSPAPRAARHRRHLRPDSAHLHPRLRAGACQRLRCS